MGGLGREGDLGAGLRGMTRLLQCSYVYFGSDEHERTEGEGM